METKRFTIAGEEHIDIYDADMAIALRGTCTETEEAAFMPELLDLRISAPNNSRVWNNWYSTQSIRATGRTRAGNAVVVYAHIPNYFSYSENITTAKNQGLINGAGKIPQDRFQELLDAQDNENVFVVDYNILKNSSSGVIPVENAINHPQTIPFCGSRERAERYLAKFREVHGDKIGIWHYDDLKDEPLGRLLFVGYLYNFGLIGISLGSLGCFVRVRRRAKILENNKNAGNADKTDNVRVENLVNAVIEKNLTIEQIVEDFKAKGVDEKQLREAISSMIKGESFEYDNNAWMLIPRIR